MKSFLCFALLTLPAAHGAPRHFFGNTATTVPPRALLVPIHPLKGKIYISAAGASVVNKAKSARATRTDKPSPPKTVVGPRWHFTPKFQEGGKDEPIYGFLLKRRF
jgi:hypothetical protein